MVHQLCPLVVVVVHEVLFFIMGQASLAEDAHRIALSADPDTLVFLDFQLAVVADEIKALVAFDGNLIDNRSRDYGLRFEDLPVDVDFGRLDTL